MKKNSLLKKISATFLSAALAVGMLSTTAFAVDQPATGSITVHKFSSTVSGTVANNTGEALADASGLGAPLAGAEFTLYRIELPILGEGESLSGAYTINDDNTVTFNTLKADGTPSTAVKSDAGVLQSAITTGTNGEVKWSDINKGYYLLRETKTPDGYDSTEPSLITLPLTKKNGTGWNADVHVYPKNVSKVPITKILDDATKVYKVGDEVPFTINAAFKNEETEDANKVSNVNDLKNGTTYGSMVITDKLADSLVFKKVALSLLKANGTKVALVENTDYTESENKVWTLTTAGIDKAIAEGATAVEVKLITTLANSSTAISNTASSTVTKAGGQTPVKPPVTPEVIVPVATIQIDKVKSEAADFTAADAKLAKAKFKLATTATPESDDDYIKDAAGKVIEVTTDATGKAIFTGMDYSVDDGNTYYLIETASPEGYQIKDAAIKVTLAANKTENFTETVQVKNYANGTIDPDNPTFSLPLTGGVGTTIFTIVGIVLMLAAVVVFVFYRVKKQKANTNNAL